jgi:hypothetical protein
MAPQGPIASRPHMPGYGIVAQDEGGGLLPWSWAEERLARARNYFVTTVRPGGRPHVMVVWGLWMDDAFLFSTGASSVKSRNLEANPRCVIAPGDADEAVIVEGVASKLADATAFERFADEYSKKYEWDIRGKTAPVWAVRPTVVFGQIETTFTTTATRWRFH